MQPREIGELTWVSDPQISPDGATVAYVLNRVDADDNKYRSQVWTVATDSSAPPRPLTRGEHKDSHPRWSPDGGSLAFTSMRDPDDKGVTHSTLQLLSFGSGGETVTLATSNEAFTGLTFSPDGSTLAVVNRVRGDHYNSDKPADRPARKITHLFSKLNGEGFVFDRPRHVHVVPVDGTASMRDITPGPWEFSAPCWMPDNHRLVVEVNRFANDYTTDIATVDIDGFDRTSESMAELLTDAGGSYHSPVVSPDGGAVVVTGFDNTNIVPQNYHLGLLTPGAASTTPDWRSRAIDRTWWPTVGRSRPVFTGPDTLVASHEDRGSTHLVELMLESGQITTMVGGDLSVTEWTCGTVDGESAIAFTATDVTTPAELFLTVNGERRRLTRHTDAFVATTDPVDVEHFLAPSGSGEDSVEVDAWIMLPDGFDPSKKYPMLLNVHGGPFTQYGNYFFDEAQMQARAGYVVVYSNPRGGSGRTDAWAQAVLGPKHPKLPGSGWGVLDYHDVMAVVDETIARFGFVDPDRLGVIGGSYGGYMASWAVTQSDRFAAACSERAANNLLALEHSSDIAGFFHAEIGPKFVDDPGEYLRMSPTSYVDRLNTPLLILHSEDDLRCPSDQAWQMFNAATVLDKPDVEFWLFPAENHELSRSGSPKHRIQRQEIINDFFDRYLSG